MTDNQLQPLEQKTVSFYDDELTAVRMEDGTVYVPVKPICERLGIAWQPQARKIRNDLLLSEVAMSITIMVTDIQLGSRRPKNTKMLALPLEYLNGWLFSVSAKRVSDVIRPNLLNYQRDCYKVLADAFGRNMVTAKPSAIDTDTTPAALAYQNALALVNMARQQYELEHRIGSAETRIDAIEATLGNSDRLITNEQASQVANAVKLIAGTLGDNSGRNEYQGVYGELYRRFGVTSYKLLPSGKYDEAVAFLNGWYQRLTDGSGIEF